MARAITAPELAKLRADGQKCELGLVISKPTSVYTARVNQSTFTDPVAQITYDGGSGTLANVKVGMTVWVGSTAGAYDKGKVRIRKAPSATVFYISECSEVVWANNDYLTIVNEVDLWPKHLVVSGSSVYMDYDVAYDDQHDAPAPVPVLGPHYAVKLAGATVAHKRDGSASWNVNGTAISAYAWTAAGPGTVTIDSVSTSAPTFTFSTAGRHLISCTVEDADGESATGYRITHVYTNAINDFTLKDCVGDAEVGGWSFSVQMFDDADRTNVVDRALVMLVARDTYGSTEGSIGPLENFEQVVCIGHIDGETITRDPDNTGAVEFVVKGPQHWLRQIPSFPVGVENTGSTATAWTNFEDLTVDKGLWHFLHWRSTATACMDIPSLTGDTKTLPSAEAPGSTSLWEQLAVISYSTILAKPACDRYGRLYVEIDTPIVPTADRSGFPTVQTIADNDWFDIINIDRKPYRRVSQVEMSGIYYDGSDATPLISKAQGKVYALYGSIEAVDNLLLASQAQLNTLSGDYFAWRNNEYPAVDLRLMQNNRFLDICPRQYAVMNLTTAQNQREVSWSSKKFIPRRVEFEHDPRAAVMTTYLELEAETTGAAAGQTIPYTPPPEVNIPPFDLGDLRLPSLGPIGTGLQPEFGPDEDPWDGETGDCPTNAPANGPFPVPMAGTIANGGGVYWLVGEIWKQGRPSGHDNPTTYELHAKFEKFNTGTGAWEETAEDNFYDVIAYDGNGDAVATGSHDAVSNLRVRTGSLTPSSVKTFRTVAVRIKDAYLFRPSVVSISETHGATGSYSYTPGTFSYTIVGGKMRAIASGYHWSWSSGAGSSVVVLWITFGAAGEYSAKPVYVQTVSMVALCSAAKITQLNSYFGGTELWSQSYSNVSGAIIGAQSSDLINAGSGSATIKHAILGSTGTYTLTLSTVLDAYLQATYRIHINGLYLYNLCPR